MKTNTNTVSTKPVYTLKDAVIDAINVLKVSGNFSAHDVTKAVRESANEGDYNLPGLEAPAGSSFKYNVRHSSIKEVLDSMLADGSLKNLGLLNVSYDGNYRIFEFAAQSTTAATGVGSSAVASNNDADGADSDSPVAKRIAGYISRQGGQTTVRNLQRALHINGLTSKDLVELLEKLNYTVTVGTQDAFSTYSVE